MEDTGLNDATIGAAFSQAWFGSPTLPAGVQLGFYGGSGVGLSTGGDEVNLFDGAGNHVTGVEFGGSPATFTSFDNAAGVGSATQPLPAAATTSTFSVQGVHGAFASASGTTEIGSPGAVAAHALISEVAPWGSGNTPYAADWFEVTNTGATPVDLTGWKMDDSSNAFELGGPAARHGRRSRPACRSCSSRTRPGSTTTMRVASSSRRGSVRRPRRPGS